MASKGHPPIPKGWTPINLYDGDKRVMLGTWVQAKFEGELMWRWDVNTYEGLFREDDLDWDFEDYLAFILLPDRLPL